MGHAVHRRQMSAYQKLCPISGFTHMSSTVLEPCVADALIINLLSILGTPDKCKASFGPPCRMETPPRCPLSNAILCEKNTFFNELSG